MSSKDLFSYKGKIIKGIIFDLDGTLYSQPKMHAYMLLKLFLYYIIRPQKLYELRVIYFFRKKRYESIGCNDLEHSQYKVTSDYLKIPIEEVRRIISFWIQEKPLKCIKNCRYSYIPHLFKQFRLMNMKIAVVSDYPIEEKLKALELIADVMVCSTDKDVNSFKPDPKGFIVASEKMDVLPENCIVIGDRDDKDGEGARLAGMSFVKNNKNNKYIFE